MRIKDKLTLAFLGMSLIPFGIASVFAQMQVEKALVAEALGHIDLVATLQKSRVQAFVSRTRERFGFVSASAGLRAALAGRPGGRDIDEAGVLRAFGEALDADPALESISLLDGVRRVRVSTDASLVGSVHPASHTASTREGVPELFVSFPRSHNVAVVTVAAPLPDGRHGLAVRTRAEELAAVILDRTGLGQTGEAFMALREPNGDARFITPLRFDPAAALSRTVNRNALEVPITRALRREEVALTDARDYRGRPVLAATRYLDETGWGLVVKVDQAEAFASLNQLRLVLWPVFVATLAAAALVSLYLSKKATAPIEVLTRAARRIERGDLDTRLGLPVRDEIGVLAGALEGMAQSLIDANAHLEDKVRQRTAQLARTNAELEQFAYIASHDLQEPLRIVSSYVGLLAKRYRGRLDADADEFIGFATDATARMRALIDDLLAYSRVGRGTVQFEPADSGALARMAVANLQETTAETRATVTIGDLPVLPCHRTQVVQVFQNLVGNALKYRSEAPPRVHVEARRRGATWEFIVTDNGVGIDPRYHERIFLIFQRLAPRTAQPGTGIGLAICKKIVEGHGGRIWVESAPGKGAAFHFELPADAEPARRESA